MLDNSNVADRIVVEKHEAGWPDDPSTLDTADTIVYYSDGRDGDKFSDVPFVLQGRMAVIEKQMQRGCGLMLMHFSTFYTDKEGEKIVDWAGGYFDWEDENGKRNWFSKINAGKTLELTTPTHPIATGVAKTLALNDEVYWRLRFKDGDKRLTPIWTATGFAADAAKPLDSVVGWAVERADGGRGFATTVGHSFRLWQDENIRRAFLNAVVWTAKAEVPSGGVQAEAYSDAQVEAALKDVTGVQKAKVKADAPPKPSDKGALNKQPLRVLMFAGNAAHKWHNWERTTPAIKAALEKDGQMQVDVSLNIEDLSTKTLNDYQVIILNSYCNWKDPAGLSEPSRDAFLKFLNSGSGGLVLLHFAGGAFHFSLPDAGASDWPEYRSIVRRIWNHHGKSGHDAFGEFRVEIAAKHALVDGLNAFTVTDELYFNQEGAEPVDALLTAKSKITGSAEPLAWTYTYGKARVFQSLLGHSEKTYAAPEVCELLRRAVAWTAGRDSAVSTK
jgi:type 1 glutamine amidotransferase